MCEKRAVPAGVDHETRLVFLAAGRLDDDARSIGEIDTRHRGLFAHVDAVLARVIEQELIEARSLDLKRSFVWIVEILVEAKNCRRRTVGGDERAAVLRIKVVDEFLVDADAPKDVVRVRQHRLADLKARKLLALE